MPQCMSSQTFLVQRPQGLSRAAITNRAVFSCAVEEKRFKVGFVHLGIPRSESGGPLGPAEKLFDLGQASPRRRG